MCIKCISMQMMITNRTIITSSSLNQYLSSYFYQSYYFTSQLFLQTSIYILFKLALPIYFKFYIENYYSSFQFISYSKEEDLFSLFEKISLLFFTFGLYQFFRRVFERYYSTSLVSILFSIFLISLQSQVFTVLTRLIVFLFRENLFNMNGAQIVLIQFSFLQSSHISSPQSIIIYSSDDYEFRFLSQYFLILALNLQSILCNFYALVLIHSSKLISLYSQLITQRYYFLIINNLEIFNMFYRYFLSILAITALLITHAHQQCQPLDQIKDFWSSSLSLLLKTDQSTTLSFNYQTYNITLPRRYNRSSNIKYAFAIKEMKVEDPMLYYFDLLILKAYQTSIIVNFIYEPNKWAKVSINYWVGFRKDLILGVQSVKETYIKKLQQNMEVSCLIKNDQISPKAIPLVFLNGLRFDRSNVTANVSTFLQFGIVYQKIIEGKLIFGFKTSQSLPLKSLTFSYIIFSPHQVQFASYGGVISSLNLSGQKSSNLYYILPTGHSYSIYGLSSIGISSTKPFQFSVDLSENYILKYGVNQWQTLAKAEITYVIIGVKPSNLCLANPQCKTDGFDTILDRKCVKQCPQTHKPNKFIDGAIQCLPCASNMAYKAMTNQCACLQGYLLQKGTCILNFTQTKVPLLALAQSGDSLLQDDNLKTNILKIVNSSQNSKNVFLTLQIQNPTMKKLANDLIRLQFPSQTQTSVSYYCTINQSKKYQYQCLILYPLGVPSQPFDITATCNYGQCSGQSITYKYTPKGKR